MARVKVRNHNTYPFTQKFQGKDVFIGAKGAPDDFVEMDEEDAVVFLGTYKPFKLDNKGMHDPAHFKMLKIERDPNEIKTDTFTGNHRCPACKEQTSSWTELEAHMRLMHQDNLVRDAEYEKYQAQKAKDNGAKQQSAGAAAAQR